VPIFVSRPTRERGGAQRLPLKRRRRQLERRLKRTGTPEVDGVVERAACRATNTEINASRTASYVSRLTGAAGDCMLCVGQQLAYCVYLVALFLFSAVNVYVFYEQINDDDETMQTAIWRVSK